jgi:hypothetical protein
MTSIETSPAKTHNPPPDHPLLSLFVNILFPVMILNKGTPHLGANTALLVALSLPLIYGAQDYFRRRHKNYVSLLGLINISLTGSLALFHLHGLWFAAKEAILPMSLGVLVFFSARTSTPAAQVMFCNPHVLNMKEIDDALAKNGNRPGYLALLRSTTLWLSLSFFISSFLNFLLALHVFQNIDASMAMAQQGEVLNQQIARMTWMSMLIIALPLMFFSGILITWFLRQLVKMTGLPMDSLLKAT